MAGGRPSWNAKKAAARAGFKLEDGATARASLPSDRKARRSLTEILRHVVEGDTVGLDRKIPLVQLAYRIKDELLDSEQKLDWHLLELFWERMEGAVPTVVESTVNVRGVIALPVITPSEIDWSASAIPTLAASSAPPLITGAVGLPSSTADEDAD